MTLFKPLACIIFEFLLILNAPVFLNAQESSNFTTPFKKCLENKDTSIFTVASDNEYLFFIFDLNGQIKALEKLQTEIWTLDIGGELAAKPVFFNKTLYILSRQVKNKGLSDQDEVYKDAGFYITAVDTFSGLSKWKKDFYSENKPYIKLFDNKLYILTDDESSSLITVLNLSDGKIFSERKLNFKFSQIFNAADSLILGKDASSLVSYSINKGERKIHSKSVVNIEAAFASGEDLIFSDKNGSFYFANASGDQRKSKIRFGAKITFIKSFQNRLLLSSNDNFLYSLSGDGKKIFWKKRLPGRITTEPIIFRGVIITYSQGDNSLYFIDFENGKILNQITTDQEIINNPLVNENFVAIQTSGGLSLYKTAECEDSAAAK